MDKKYKILIVLIIVLVFASVLYFFLNKEDKLYPVTEDSLLFQKEYSTLNGKSNNDREYLEIKLPANVPVKYVTYDEVFEILEKKSGVIFFGFPECPWCRNIIKPLIDSAMEYGLNTIYYLNNREDRNILEINKNDQLEVIEDGSEDYLKLLDVLHEYLPEYGGLDNKDIKRLYFPTILFIKDGDVIGVESILDSYSKRVSNNPYIKMLNEEIDQLKEIFKKHYKKIEN